jgi:cytochrome c553
LKTVTLLGTLVFVSVCAVSLQVRSPDSRAGLPQYTNGDELVRPEYQEWIFLSSRLRMATSAEGETMASVFVPRSAYHQFLGTGSWPDKTVLVMETRMASNTVSSKAGDHYETDLISIYAEVKDTARFPEKWAYFSFDSSAKTAKANPKAECSQCHHSGGAVENTYVQFYPTLKPLAQKFGTYQRAPESPDASRK